MPWNNYPKAARDNASKALKHREENGTDCGTPVGWQRANTLSKGEPISDDVLVRTYSFLSRAKVYNQGKFFDEDGKEICGSIMYAAWGGDEMLSWAKRTIEQMEEKKRHIKSVIETDDEIVITFGKSEMEENGYKEEERAEPDELSVGDFVKWNSSGGNAYGRIIQVETDGVIEADSGFEVNGTSDDPAALIRLFRYSSEEDAYIERKPVLNVAHRFSSLEKFDAEVRKSSGVIEQREFRMESMEHNGNVVRGYAAVYDSDSEFMGYYEQIEKGAFDDVMNDDVRAYYNHDENYLLGRVSSGTLRIGTDKRGLFYEVDLPNTTYANDLVELMKRGDINQSSFAFLIGQDRWEERDGKTYRIIEKVSRLIDVSPVAMPAYQMATSELKRDLETETPPIETTPTDAVDSGSNDGEEVSNIYLYKSKILNLTR
jgi:HK97 family phage prohead protease